LVRIRNNLEIYFSLGGDVKANAILFDTLKSGIISWFSRQMVDREHFFEAIVLLNPFVIYQNPHLLIFMYASIHHAIFAYSYRTRVRFHPFCMGYMLQ